MEVLAVEVLERCVELIRETEEDEADYKLSSRLAEHCLSVAVATRGWDEALTNGELDDAQRRELVEASADHCMKRDDPALRTVKLQVAVDDVSRIVDDSLHRLVENRETSNIATVASIVKMGKLRGDAQVTKLYKEIFNLIVANEEDGTVDRRVEREIAAALQSAFPRSDVDVYSKAATQVKRAQISRLIDIVLGVRLYNWSIGKGGAGIDDLPAILQEEIEALYGDIQPGLQTARRQEREVSAVLALESKTPGSISSPVDELRAEAGCISQQIRYLVELQQDILESRDLIRDSTTQLKTELRDVQELIGSRQSVPKGQVFPKFAAMAVLWRAVVLEREANRGRASVFQIVQTFRSRVSLSENDLRASQEAGLMEDRAPSAPTVRAPPEQASERALPRVATEEMGAQSIGTGTPTHIVESHIDPSYCWNEWEMRRRALQMVRIRNCRTHSTQTHLSHFRRDAETQDNVKHLQEDGTMPGVGVQTRKDQGTSVPKPVKYYRNLRGDPAAKFEIAEVNLPIDKEQHSCIADEIAYETYGRTGKRQNDRVVVEFADGKVKDFCTGDVCPPWKPPKKEGKAKPARKEA